MKYNSESKFVLLFSTSSNTMRIEWNTLLEILLRKYNFLENQAFPGLLILLHNVWIEKERNDCSKTVDFVT